MMVEPGDTVTVTGLRGTFTVRQIRPDQTVTVYGGTKMREKFRTFAVERIKEKGK